MDEQERRRREIEADLQRAQDAFAQVLALAAVTLSDGDMQWIDLRLLELRQDIQQRLLMAS